jgi:hypothetical protein
MNGEFTMPITILEAAAMAMAGDCCCGLRNDDGTCCFSDRARDVFAAIAEAGGPTLDECEAIARGDAVVNKSFARKAIEAIHAEEQRLKQDATWPL